jgi:hypothetical protein
MSVPLMRTLNDLSNINGSGETFLVRWRGKQEGPYPTAVIQNKLDSHEIGLLHEIFSDGEWVTLRDYIARKEAILAAQRRAAAEEERLAREQIEVRLHEEHASEAAKSQPEPREILDTHLTTPVPQPREKESILQAAGALSFLGGLALAGYFFLFFETSVESGVGRVVNFGLLADRQNGIIIGLGLAIVGTILLVLSSRKS